MLWNVSHFSHLVGQMPTCFWVSARAAWAGSGPRSCRTAGGPISPNMLPRSRAAFQRKCQGESHKPLVLKRKNTKSNHSKLVSLQPITSTFTFFKSQSRSMLNCCYCCVMVKMNDSGRFAHSARAAPFPALPVWGLFRWVWTPGRWPTPTPDAAAACVCWPASRPGRGRRGQRPEIHRGSRPAGPQWWWPPSYDLREDGHENNLTGLITVDQPKYCIKPHFC